MFMILTLLMSGFNTFAQTDNRHKSRLDIKPKSKTSSSPVTFKKTAFSFFQPTFLSFDKNSNYQRSTVINQYFTNSFLLQPIRNQVIKVESIVVQPVVLVIENDDKEPVLEQVLELYDIIVG